MASPFLLFFSYRGFNVFTERTHSQIRRISLSTLEQLWFGPPQGFHALQLVQLETRDCKCYWTNLKYISFICASFQWSSDMSWYCTSDRQTRSYEGVIPPQTHNRWSAQWGKGSKKKTGFWTPVLPPQCSVATLYVPWCSCLNHHSLFVGV